MSIFDKILDVFYKGMVRPDINEPISLTLPFKSAFMRVFVGSIPFVRDSFYTKFYSNERIVEMPFVHRHLNIKKGGFVLDFGCAESKLSIELASSSYNVTGVDLQNYRFRHPNFKFLRGNFLEAGIEKNSFDACVAVSAIEHCGLDWYDSTKFNDGDYKIVHHIHSILKSNGLFIITVPFGKPFINKFLRVYDAAGLKNLLRDFEIVHKEFSSRGNGDNWQLCSEKDALLHEYAEYKNNRYRGVDAVAMVVCKKRK